MNSWQFTGEYRQSREWRLLASVSEQLKQTSHNLRLAEDREWLRFVLGEIANQMIGTLGWAEDLARRVVGDAADEFSVLIVPADAARSDVVAAIYCLDFMLAENLIDAKQGTELRDQLTNLQHALEALVKSLRQGDVRPSRFANN